jgi:acetyl-CoA decarbonylase/synthase complex subunit epsilon
MSDRTTPYQPTAGTNLNHAEIVSPTILIHMIKRSKNPILIVGCKLEKDVEEILSKLSMKKIYTPKEMNLLDIMKYLAKGEHDLALFVGITYFYLAQVITHLKHFSSVITVTIDPYYNPNARYSFPNMDKNEHVEVIRKLVDALGDN